MDASRASLLAILAYLDAELARGAQAVEIDVVDPDVGRGLYAGESIAPPAEGAPVASGPLVHRPLKLWVDLAERRGIRLCTPRPLGGSPPRLRLRFEPLDPAARLRGDNDAGSEKYGTSSEFARIHKLEDPGVVLDMADALARVAPQSGWRVLDLGVNTGDELELLLALSPALRDATFVGVDHSASAIAAARERFARLPDAAGTRIELHVADIAQLSSLSLGRFDLVISIGTLQSPGIDDRDVLRRIVQDHLTPTGSLILGVPNCRYIDGEVEYGTRMKNFRQPELGLLVKDVAFYRKYLQQHHRRVFVTGKHYVLVTAVPASA